MEGRALPRVAAPRGRDGDEGGASCSSPALSTPSASAELSAGATGELCRYTTAALAAATDGFSPARLLGEGGYGEVFAARWPDGTVLAVKRMAADATEGESGFLAEVSVTGAVRHPNVLPVLGVVRGSAASNAPRRIALAAALCAALRRGARPRLAPAQPRCAAARVRARRPSPHAAVCLSWQRRKAPDPNAASL